MSSATRVLGVAVVVAVLLCLLVACGGSQPQSRTAGAREKVLAAGTCWDDQQLPDALGPQEFGAWVNKYADGDATLGRSMRDDAAFSTSLDCSDPHALEVYNVVTLSPRLSAQVSSYAELLDHSSALYRKVRDQVNDRCNAASPYGLAERRAGGLPVQLGPSLTSTGALHVAWDPFPADLWARGQKRFVCTFEQDRPGTLRFADLTTSQVPVTARVCLNTPGTYVSCAGRHQAEDIAEMILNTAIEHGRISGRKAVRTGPEGAYVALSDAEYAKLDRVCQALLSSVAGVPAGVTARAYPGAVAQWPTKAGTFVASCFALKPGDPPPPVTGTVFGRG